jgi:hypothetical protein
MVAFALAGGVPFAAYLATASPHGYWLDGGEFVESAAALDIAHPPGHPLAAMLGWAAVVLLPFGSIAFRVALAQAACAAVAAGFVFSAIDTTVRALEVRHDRLAIPIALGATWLVACAYPAWFQAVRPEVYALQALLIAVAIERAIAIEAAWPTNDVRAVYAASIAIGLALANHHFMAVLVLPALAPTLARAYRARGGRAMGIALGGVVAGLAAYVYLPVRAHVDPPVNLGDPGDLERFLWVVSARAYQHADRFSLVSPLERAGEVVLAIVDDVPLVALVLALAGVWALLRAPGARRIGWVWVAALVCACAGRSWMGNTSGNPDALGYLSPAFVAIAALAAAFVGAVVAQMGGSSPDKPGAALTAVAVLAALLGLAPLEASRARASLATFHATDELDELRIRRLPPRAVVVAHLPQTVFRHWELSATEQVRPDVTIVPIPFLGYPGMVQQLAERDPTLGELLRGYLLEGELRQPDLQSLAARRPVLVEMDVRVPRRLYDTMVPSGLYYEVVDAGWTATDVREASAHRAEALDRLTRALGGDRADPETRNQLLWIHYVDALDYAALGARDPARESVRRALSLAPEATELRALSDALATGEGPLDVTPFLVGPPE